MGWNMRFGWISGLIIWTVSATTFSNAAIVPGRWEKVEALEQGYPISVKLNSGERFKALYQGSAEKAIRVKKGSGEELEVPKAAVVKITSQQRNSDDGLRNGAIIGLVAGAVFGLAYPWEERNAGAVAVSAALFGAIGMGVGVGVDAIVKGHDVLYQARNE